MDANMPAQVDTILASALQTVPDRLPAPIPLARPKRTPAADEMQVAGVIHTNSSEDYEQ